ncbi:hypothetical protein U728_3753 (plasmid) [Clostridium botulinum 202F]|nr:hypothetical protein U728_3753 [Clostridium botulinum 202F]KAI3344503.1 hypothetical protein CIT17_17160 [Clostridium botulinum]KON13497.1 hypothetical protein ACP50_05355 [Clostridium botulinum]MBY6987870.1 hypothetical protein [Clostridium botulinum]NFH01472.1 hypothetical protein [Clostridium botulinum]
MFLKSRKRDNSDFANLTKKWNIEIPKDVKSPKYERPKRPGTSTAESLMSIKPPLHFSNVINISGIDPKDIQALKLELAKFNFGTLDGIQVNINEKRERTKIFITLENKEFIDTFSDETIDEINSKLNSNKEFITIGNLNVKRKSVISVSELENKCEDKS